MSPEARFERRIIGSFILGAFVALTNFALDILFARFSTTATNALNDIVIGSAAGLLAYIWVSREATKQAFEASKQEIVQEALSNDRKRIALELHDTVCQAHTSAILHVECAGNCVGDNPAAQEHLQRTLQLIRGSMMEMRCALWDLYPEELQKMELKTAIEALVKDLTAGNGLSIELSLDGAPRRLPAETERALLKISQEALSNVVKHAHAHQVRIELVLDAQRARLCVKDDGQGFQPELHQGTFGLTSMRNRTRALGGVYTIYSEPGRGTEVRASIPISMS